MDFRKKSLLLIFILLFVSMIAAGCGKSLEDQITDIFTATSELRQLSPSRDVEYEFISSEELQIRYEQMIKEEYIEEEMATDQEIYVMLDLMEDGQDLLEILTNVASEQIIGYYDDESNNLYVISERDKLGLIEEITLSHEYTHALQDQHFGLDSMLLSSENNSDAATAYLSLVEGDATLTSSLYVMSEFTLSDIMNAVDDLSGIDTDYLDSAPQIIRENMLFPYEAGMNFISEFDDLTVINEAYTNPPQSTEQILHPEKYLNSINRDDPIVVVTPNIQSILGNGWEMRDNDVLGELNTRIYLDTYIPTVAAKRAATGWGGDCLQYWKDNKGEQLIIMYWVWDSLEDAEEFYNAYGSFMNNKIDDSWDIINEDDYSKHWQVENQAVYLSLHELNTLVVVSTNSNIVEDVIAEFQ